MTTLSRTNHSQRPGTARAAYHLNAVPIDDMTAGKTVTLFIERWPLPVTIEPLHNFEFFGIRQFDGRKQE